METRDKGCLNATTSNAVHLLRKLGKSSGGRPCLWIVDGELFYSEIGPIMGCAAFRTAFSSDAGLDCGLLARKTLHEVGHVLGTPTAEKSAS